MSGLPLTETQRQLLASLWITSAEELVALASALDGSPKVLEAGEQGTGLTAAALSARQVLPVERAATLSAPRRGGGLGCLVAPEILDEVRRQGRVRPESARPEGAFEAKLPPAVRLVGRLPPVRDQGKRGTCVAFGTTALREFLIGRREDLSEQFLYWACKELDGIPGPGTYIHTAMTALAEYGICEEEVWPYNPKPTNDEGQGPPPPQARPRAKEYLLPVTRTVEPNLPIHYKNILAGNGKGEGMPVTFGTLVFDSWYMSAETHRTGKVTMPLPREHPVGGHAWCVVGYVDDASVPGGGYFIVRNSWGAAWAAESPEVAGHAMMPYAYVERFALEAFTGPAARTSAPMEEADSVFREYVRALAARGRDLDDKGLPAGTRVLCHPSEPDHYYEDTPANREAFRARDFTWTDEARSRVWYGNPQNADIARLAASCQAIKKHFLDAISENMTTATRQPFPEVHQPLLHKCLPWEPKIWRVEELADLTETFAAAVRASRGVPAGVPCPDSWRQVFDDLGSLRVLGIKSFVGARIDVVVGFVVPLHFNKSEAPVLATPDAVVVEAACRIYKAWLDRSRAGRPVFTFFTLGSPQPWAEEVRGTSAGDHWVMCSSPGAERLWDMRKPPRFADRPSLADFRDRLEPVTRQERISRVKTLVDELLDYGPGGNVHLELIKRELAKGGIDYRRSAIANAMEAMRQRGGYRIYRTPQGVYAIDRKVNEPGVTIRRVNLQRVVWRHVATAVGFAIPPAVWQMVAWGFGLAEFQWTLIVLSPVAGYLTSIFTKPLTKIREEKE